MSEETREDMRALRTHLKAGRADARLRQIKALRRLQDDGVLLLVVMSPFHLRVRRRDTPDVVWDVWPGTPTFRRVGAGRGEYGWAGLMKALGLPGVSAP